MDDATGSFFVLSLLVLAACGAAGYLLLARTGRGATGWLAGFFLGPLGVLIAWVTRDNALRDGEGRGPIQGRSTGSVDVRTVIAVCGTLFGAFALFLYMAAQ
jgi:hypothetical protein